MTRSKQEMKLIVDPKKRRMTYRNRRDGLVQKASQLATLCDIDVFLVCFPSAAGGGEVTVWPSDGRVVEDLVARFRALPTANIKQALDTRALLQEGLAKEQRRLYKVRQYGADNVLTAWDSSLDHLTVDGLKDLHVALDEALQRTRERIDALRRGSAVDEVVPSAVTAPATRDIVFAPSVGAGEGAAPAQHAPAVLFGFPLNSSGAGTGGSQYHYNPHRFLPQPPPLVDQMVQMPPPRLSIQMPPSWPPLAAPSDMASAGFMENLPYTTNVLNSGGLYGDLGQVFSGGAGYNDGFHSFGNGFHGHGSFVSAATGFDLDVKHNLRAGVWPTTLNNPMGIIPFEMHHNSGDLPRSSGSSFHGGFN